MSAIYEHSLTQIRGLLADGQLRPTELAAACIARIKATEPLIKATIAPLMEESAMDAARALEQSGPDPAKPLWGIPLTLKDCICTKGHPTTCGSKMLENFVPFYDATVVERLRQAGAVIVAKTNMDEFAMGSTTESSAMHVTLNPWDRTRVPGGSSGGSAASVAACQAFGSLGSDTGGSIRQPAAFCGCVGMKPTYGVVPRYGVSACASSMDQAGPITRCVADAARIFQTIAGYDPREATSMQLPVPDCMAALGRRDLKGLRIGLPKEFWHGNSTEVDERCRSALDTARQLGATLVDVSMPHVLHGVAAYYIICTAEGSTNMARFDGVRFGKRDGDAAELEELYVRSRSKYLGDEVKRRIIVGTFVLSSGYYEAYFRKAAQVRRLILQEYQAALAQCDILAAPSAPQTAWHLGETAGDPALAYQRDVLTVTLNLAGLPGLSMPVGLGSESGMPVGLQLMARALGEAAMFGIAHCLEQALPPIGHPKLV